MSARNSSLRRRLRDTLLVHGGSAAALVLLRVLGWTTRKQFVGAELLMEKFATDQRVILSFWHGQLVMMPFAYRGRGACIMNSQHRDGEIISRAIGRLGIEAVRGSSTRGWVGGLRGLLEAHRRGRDLVVVPDGPRGPRCRAKPGVVQLARATETAIFPVAYSAKRGIRLRRSWDAMRIPYPFSRVVYVVGSPIEVPADAGRDEVERLRGLVEERLNEATRRADGLSGVAFEVTEAYISGALQVE